MKNKIFPSKVNLYIPIHSNPETDYKLPCFMPVDGDFSDLQFDVEKSKVTAVPYSGEEKQSQWFVNYKYPPTAWSVVSVDNEEFKDVVLLGTTKINSYTAGFSVLVNDEFVVPVNNEECMFAFSRPVVGQRFQIPFRFAKTPGSKILKFMPIGCPLYKKLEDQHNLTQLKTIKASELKPGFIYRKKPTGEYVLHLGKVNCNTSSWNKTREVDNNFCLSLSNFNADTVTIDQLLDHIANTTSNWKDLPYRSKNLPSIVEEVRELKGWNKFFPGVKAIDQSPNRPMYREDLLTITKA